jgi:hypothetical protein
MLTRRRPRRRGVSSSTVRRLRLLQLDAILLTVVVVTLGASAIVSVVRCGVGWCSLVVLVVVVVWLLVVLAWSGSPACAVEGLATGFATFPCGEAGAAYEE